MNNLKYLDTKVVFAEVPDEITLAINITGCPCLCKGCHSSYLWEDIGEELTDSTLISLINNNKGISCIAFMGGDKDSYEVNRLAKVVRDNFKDLKIAWYSGRDHISYDFDLNNFDYLKIGSYKEDKGPLTSKNTNQIFYRIGYVSMHVKGLIPITYKFWK